MSYFRKMSTNVALKDKRSLIRKRMRVNAITTFGHFATWVMKMSLMTSVVVKHFLFNKGQFSYFDLLAFHLGPTFNFVMYPLVQTLSSDSLRAELVKVLRCEGVKLRTECHFSIKLTFRSASEENKTGDETKTVENAVASSLL